MVEVYLDLNNKMYTFVYINKKYYIYKEFKK